MKRRGRPKSGVKRDIGKFFRVSKGEEKYIEEIARLTGLDEADIIRCKIFGYSYESQGGHQPKKSLPNPPENPPIPLA